MEEYVGKICPFCKTEIKEDEQVKVCPACGVPHHELCWNVNGGCKTCGCAEQHQEEQQREEKPLEEQPAEPSKVCPSCKAPVGNDQTFCPKCGAPLAAPKKNVCSACGAELTEGVAFCTKCGRRIEQAPAPVTGITGMTGMPAAQGSTGMTNMPGPTGMTNVQGPTGMTGMPGVNGMTGMPGVPGADEEAKKKKKKKSIIIASVAIGLVVAIIIGIIAAVAIQKQNKEKAIAEYLDTANEFYNEVLSSGATIETVGNTIQSYWYTYVFDNGYYYKKYSSVDDAVSQAQSAESSNISKVKSSKSDIDNMYSKLLDVPDDSGLDDVKSAVVKAYDAYEDMYDCVINVSGNYTTYKSKFGSTDSALSSALTDLKNTLSRH